MFLLEKITGHSVGFSGPESGPASSRVPMTSAPFTKFYKNLLTKLVSLLYNTINKSTTVVLQ